VSWAGYGSTRAWRTLRDRVLRRDPTCAIGGPGCTVTSTIADHIVPRAEGGTDDLDNLQGVCAVCSDAKTKQEAARGRARARARRRLERKTERHPGAI
jgi:5-methylcytosine-specific restriction protein A